MALQVWLPLNGDLHNQGLTNIVVINSGATVDNNGKIGKCYSFNGSSSKIYKDNFTTIGNTTLSACCWMKISNWSSTYAYIFSLASGGTGVTQQIGLWLNHSSHKLAACGGGTKPTTTPELSLNTWYHVCLVINGNKKYFYLNGELSDTYTISSPQTGNCLCLGARSNSSSGAGTAASLFFNGCINDFRLYDHALSSKEVEKIAQGLVLHYKLNDLNIESTTNLVTQLKQGGRTTLDSTKQVITTTTENADTYWYFQTASGLIENTTYTLSLVCEGLPTANDFWQFGVGAQSGANNCGHFKIYNGFNTFTFTLPTGLNGATQIILDDNGGSSNIRNNATKFYNVQLEAKDHATEYAGPNQTRTASTVYDSSGYNHNGSITGNLILSNNTPKYKITTQLSDSASSIGIGNLSTYLPEKIFTFNIWFKKITGEWSSKSWETILGGPSGFELEGKLSSTTKAYIHPYSWGGGSTSSPNSYSIEYTLDEWHMLTMVRTTSDSKFYLDGELKVTGSAGSLPSGDYFLGAWQTAIKQNYRGYFSDVYIYATALTADQIKELYNNSKIINGTTIVPRGLE